MYLVFSLMCPLSEGITRLLEQILRLLYLQRQHCSRLERFFKVNENIFVFKTHKPTRYIIRFYNAGVVTK
jgi:hypothetical protein